MRVVLIDSDPIFRLGLRIALERVPSIQIVGDAETGDTALALIAELTANDTTIDLIIFALNLNSSQPQQSSELQLCRQLKAQYPDLPILVLSGQSHPNAIAAIRVAGVDGYAPKGIATSELVTAIEQVATGSIYGFPDSPGRAAQPNLDSQPSSPRLFNPRRWSGIDYINANLAEITAQLQIPGLPLLQQLVLAGRRRELLTARWLVRRLVPSPPQQLDTPNSPPLQLLPSGNFTPQTALTISAVDLNRRLVNLQTTIFSATVAKLQLSLQNISDEPLEIDILKAAKKRKLLYLILRKLTQALDEMRSAKIELHQLEDKRNFLLRDIWQESISDFFGKYSTVRGVQGDLAVVDTLLAEIAVVHAAILDKIPLVTELLAYLLFDVPLTMGSDGDVSNLEMSERAEIILQNLSIQLANAVMQPLLNNFANVEAIKQGLYDTQLLSTRQIESFRNNLSWKYRWQNYLNQPKSIFESRYELFVLAPRGIAKISIYAPRTQELAQLSGIPLFVTLAIELRDALSPRLRATVAYLGSGVVYVLTQVIGRTIGLIGRGILQGLGNVSIPDKKLRK